MLRPKIRERIHGLHPVHRSSFFTCLQFGAIHVKLLIDGIVRSLHETLVFLFALQHRDAKSLTIGSHLRDISRDKGNLNDQIDIAGPLDRNRAVSLTILVGDTLLSERSIFKQNVDFAVYRVDRGKPVNFSYQLIRIGSRLKESEAEAPEPFCEYQKGRSHSVQSPRWPGEAEAGTETIKL